MQYGFYFDQNRCTGCFTCVVACHDWHDVPAGPASWLRVKTTEKGQYPDLFVSFLAMACYHCLEPACVPACPVDAIAKRDEDGIVTVDREVCLGRDNCSLCLEACPYDAPQFGAEENSKMQKCNFCIDRWEEGKKPACVQSCPTWALDAGSMDELKAKYGDVGDADGFVYSEELIPSITFKPKKDTKGLVVQKIKIKPSTETAK
jgi:anaerobic dimethyl sulfoxide reductase subunit B (iron-sulfur subunit)